jgi:hypothetical protein
MFADNLARPLARAVYAVYYDFGIEVYWLPLIVERFPGRLPEIAREILAVSDALGTTEIGSRWLRFRGEPIVFHTWWDYDIDLLGAAADIGAWTDDGVDRPDRDPGGRPFARPVAASRYRAH